MSEKPKLWQHFHGENGEKFDEIIEATIKESEVQNTNANVSSDIIRTTDTFDRPNGGYAEIGSYTPAFVEAASGQACLEHDIVAEINGPSVSLNVEVSPVKVEAMARAEVASASVKAGPVGMKVGLGFDTGTSVGPDQLEAKLLGTGVSFGSKNSVSVLGSEVSCSVM